MTIEVDETAIILIGACGVEEVETLVDCLEKLPHLPVDLSAATAIHTALWQALMVFRSKLTEMPGSPSIAEKVQQGLNNYFREKTEE
jgi:hypothetical protein